MVNPTQTHTDKYAGAVAIAVTALLSTSAQACPTFHTLANGNTADASQVMDNFNNILQCPDFTGNVGIGTTTPLTLLQINGNNGDGQLLLTNAANTTHSLGFGMEGSAGQIIIGAATGDASIYSSTTGKMNFSANGGGSAQMVLLNNGNFGIGTTTPAQALEVNGQVKVDAFASASATSVCQNANVLSSCSSSIRYKENVRDAAFGLNEILKMRPVTFKWKGRDEIDLGFIAEEIEKIDPLFVTYKEGKIEGVKYPQLTAVLANAVKELKSTNNSQAVEIERLRSENDLLKKHVAEVTALEDQRLSAIEAKIGIHTAAKDNLPSSLLRMTQ